MIGDHKGHQKMTKTILFATVIFVLAGCMSSADKDKIKNFKFPIKPASDEIVIYVARGGRYGSDWEYFSLELNNEYKILNADDCNYFVVKGDGFKLRSKKRTEDYPIATLMRTDLSLGESYYFIQEGTGRENEDHFEEVEAKDIIPICAKYGFGRVMNDPPNERWGKNDLKIE